LYFVVFLLAENLKLLPLNASWPFTCFTYDSEALSTVPNESWSMRVPLLIEITYS